MTYSKEQLLKGAPKNAEPPVAHDAMASANHPGKRGHTTATVEDAQTLRSAPAVHHTELLDGGENPKPLGTPEIMRGMRSRLNGATIQTVGRERLPEDIKDDE
jgi:hypothetical protein